eukprot:748904-Hanusia_phi.AAC.1
MSSSSCPSGSTSVPPFLPPVFSGGDSQRKDAEDGSKFNKIVFGAGQESNHRPSFNLSFPSQSQTSTNKSSAFFGSIPM